MKFDVGTRIQQICTERGISLKQLMKESGLSHSTLVNLLTNKSSPSLGTILKVCSVLNVSISEFLKEKEFNSLTENQKKILLFYRALDEEDKRIFLNFTEILKE